MISYIYYFSPILENQFIIYVLIFLTFIFFILSLDIKLNEIKKILLFPFIIIKKLTSFFIRNKKKVDTNTNVSSVHLERQSNEENASNEKQPILPFSNKRATKSVRASRGQIPPSSNSSAVYPCARTRIAKSAQLGHF